MKAFLKSVLFISFLFSSTITYSQVWELVYDSITTMGRQVILTNDSCYLVTCTDNSEDPGISLKIDQEGNIIWFSPFGGWSVVQTYDNNYVIAKSDWPHAILQKVAANGGMGWYKIYGGEHQEDINSVIESSDSGLVACGWSHNHGDSTFSIMKTDPSGNIMWQRVYPSTDFGVFWQVVEFDHHYYVVGNENNNSSGYSGIFLVKLTMEGTTVWQKMHEIGMAGYCIAVTRDSALIVGGIHRLTRLNLDGDTIWSKYFNYRVFSLDITNDDGYILSGCKTTNPPLPVLTKFNSIGEREWVRSFPTNTEQYMSAFSSVRTLADDGYIACGYSEYADKTEIKLRVLKTDETGSIFVDINDPEEHEPCIIFPNPGNGKYVIDLESVNAVQIFDVNGKEIHAPVIGRNIDLSDHKNGIYIVRISTPKGIIVQKIINN